jgi:hypothetical protein
MHHLPSLHSSRVFTLDDGRVHGENPTDFGNELADRCKAVIVAPNGEQAASNSDFRERLGRASHIEDGVSRAKRSREHSRRSFSIRMRPTARLQLLRSHRGRAPTKDSGELEMKRASTERPETNTELVAGEVINFAAAKKETTRISIDTRLGRDRAETMRPLARITSQLRDEIRTTDQEPNPSRNRATKRTRRFTATFLTALVGILTIALVDDSAEAAPGSRNPGPRNGSAMGVRAALASVAIGQTSDPDCVCEATFSGVGSVEVLDCDFFSTNSCGQKMWLSGGLGSRDFEGCECTCYEGEEIVVKTLPRDDEDGYFVRGVPDFWQYDWGCTFNGSPNAVGCGPVAMAEVLYWYASRGYPELVKDHLVSQVLLPEHYELYQAQLAQDGLTEPDLVHVWKTLVNGLRSDYLRGTGGVCGNGQYGTSEEGFMTIEDYARDHGVAMSVEAFKIKRSTSGYGLGLIKDELEAGRPLVMRFNWKGAKTAVFRSGGEDIFSGPLSNSGKYNDHYAVVTGYRQTPEGRDVIYLNMGAGKLNNIVEKIGSSEVDTGSVEYGFNGSTRLPVIEAGNPGTDTPVEWNPTGKWVRLYTIRVTDNKSSLSNCESSVTTVRDPQYLPDSNSDTEFKDSNGNPTGMFVQELGFSHANNHSTYTDIIRNSQNLDDCGKVLDYQEISDPLWSTQTLECPNQAGNGTLEPESSPSGIGDRLEP